MRNSILFKLAILSLTALIASAIAFGQVDVARRTTAITYPLDETVLVQFRGTTRFPRMKGEARVKRNTRSGTRIELSVEKMPRPFELGAGYATYVVWAVSPDGQVDNLGEIKRSGFSLIDSKITVTTPLQTFALIITAEPHFMVQRPSQAIMMENLGPVATSGKRINTTPSIQYFGNSSDYFHDPRTPEIAEIDYSKTPAAILQAQQAIALAKFAGAERDAPAELNEALTLYQNAENSWHAGRDSDSVDIAARKAIGSAVKAESLAFERKQAREKRNEQIRNDSAIRTAETRFNDAQNQISDLKDELDRETRNRELAERDVLNSSNQVKDLRAENNRLSEELGRVRADLDAADAKIAAAQKEKQALQEQRDNEIKAATAKAAESDLMTALKAFGPVTKNERGIVLTLPETFWTSARSSTLAPPAATKLTSLAEVLSKNPDYRILIESHTDNSGDPTAIQVLTDKRSYAVADKLASSGIEEGRIVAKGLGASVPVAPNTTAANRAKNRRVLVILSPIS